MPTSSRYLGSLGKGSSESSSPAANNPYDALIEKLRFAQNPSMFGEAPVRKSDGISGFQSTLTSERGHSDEKPRELSSVNLGPIPGPPKSSAVNEGPPGFPRYPAAPLEKNEGKQEPVVDFERGDKMHEVETDGTLQLAKDDDGMDLGVDSRVDLEDIFTALTNAQSEIERVEKKWHGTEISMRDERNELKAALEDETRRSKETRFALEEWITKAAALEAERDAAVLDATKARKREKRKVLFMRKRSRVKTQRTVQAFDAIVVSLQHQRQALEAGSNDFKRVARAQLMSRRIEQAKLQRELDIARNSLRHENNRFDIELGNAMTERRKAEEHLETVKGQRDAFKRERDDVVLALDVQKANVVEGFNEKLRITKLLRAAECKKRRLEYDLIVAAEEAADEKMQWDLAHKAAQEKARSEFRELEVKLLEAGSQKSNLEAELISMGEKCTRLEAAQKSVQNSLEEEKEKSLCQICFENPKNSIAFPCLHLNFCFSCLDSHRAQKNTCPTCRTAISGVLKCVVCV